MDPDREQRKLFRLIKWKEQHSLTNHSHKDEDRNFLDCVSHFLQTRKKPVSDLLAHLQPHSQSLRAALGSAPKSPLDTPGPPDHQQLQKSLRLEVVGLGSGQSPQPVQAEPASAPSGVLRQTGCPKLLWDTPSLLQQSPTHGITVSQPVPRYQTCRS